MGKSVERWRDERGISAVVVAVCLVGLFGAATLSVDAGNLFAARRGMVTATDTSALVGARAAVGTTTAGPCPGTDTTGVRGAVLARLQEQQPDATLVACTLSPSSAKSGYITVDATKVVPLRFGAVVNLGSYGAFSSTSVRYGYPTGASGLRPIGICLDNPHIQEWLDLKEILGDPLRSDTEKAAAQSSYNALEGSSADHPSYDTTFPDAGVVHRVFFNQDNASDCAGLNDAAGNWGWMDFNGGNNTNADLRDWLINGYDAEVGIHIPVPACVLHDPPDGCLNGETGDRGNAFDTELAALRDNQVRFHVPIFEYAIGPGNNAMFTIRAFVGVILRGYQSTPSAGSYFDVEFYNAIVSGGCCADTGIDTGLLRTRICAVDHDAQAEGSSVRCG